jgi:hypothetical protein
MANYRLTEGAKEELLRNVQLLSGVDRLSASLIVASGLDGSPCEAYIEALRKLVKAGDFDIEV